MVGSGPPTRRRPAPQFLAVGRVLRPHGVRGELLVEVAPDSVALFAPRRNVYLGPRHRRFEVRWLRPHRRQYLLALERCVDRKAAERWRGVEIHVRLSELEPLPPGVFYDWQLIGLEVRSVSGEALGRLVEILRTGANDVYLVRGGSGDEILLPAIDSVVLDIDLEAGRMRVQLPPGLRDGQA